MNCQFCGSKIPPKSDICPQCGGNQNLDTVLPPPSPYFEAVMPAEPPKPDIKAEPKPEPVEASSPTQPERPTIAESLQNTKSDPGTMALIALIIGIAGIPLAFTLLGCSLPINAIGIFLAWLGLKSEKRGMAITALVLNIGTIVVVILVFVIIAVFGIIGITSAS